jgi:hypothetical protein
MCDCGEDFGVKPLPMCGVWKCQEGVRLSLMCSLSSDL